MNETHCASDLAIDRYLSGELEAKAATGLELHAAGCERCGARLAELRAETEATREALPPLSPGPELRTPWIPLLAVAAGLIMAVFIGRALLAGGGAEREAPTRVATTRTKGPAHLTLYVRRDARVFTFGGEPLSPGDGLAFAYTSGADSHLALFDVDDGEAACLYPASGATAPAPAGVDVDLDVAVELDDSRSEESIVAVFCETPQPTSVLARVLSSGDALPASCTAEWVRLPKEDR